MKPKITTMYLSPDVLMRVAQQAARESEERQGRVTSAEIMRRAIRRELDRCELERQEARKGEES